MRPDDVRGRWEEFRSAFVDVLEKTDSPTFASVWHDLDARTGYYRHAVIPRVAEALGLVVRPELLRVDWALCRRSSREELIPEIFVESENDGLDAGQEMRKLCWVCAPVRVVVICEEWDSTRGGWPHGGRRARILGEWAELIRDHEDFWPRPGITGVIVGEWGRDLTLRFYALALDARGEVCEAEQLRFERSMRGVAPGTVVTPARNLTQGEVDCLFMGHVADAGPLTFAEMLSKCGIDGGADSDVAKLLKALKWSVGDDRGAQERYEWERRGGKVSVRFRPGQRDIALAECRRRYRNLGI